MNGCNSAIRKALDMHKLIEIPEGKRVQDLLPIYATAILEIGNQCPVCPSCSKPFTAARKPRVAIKLYPIKCGLPIVFAYRLCGRCAKDYHDGGDKKSAVLASVQRFVEGTGTSS